MNVAVFSAKPHDRRFLDAANIQQHHTLTYFEPRLQKETARLAGGFEAVCCFINDSLSPDVLQTLAEGGTRFIALRSAGFNHVDLNASAGAGMRVLRVPAYSPYAVAEHALALILTLNRKTHHAYNRVRDGNFSLEGLIGFDIHGSTVGIVGTGKIGFLLAKTLAAMGARILGHDPYPNADFRGIGGEYADLPSLLRESDIVSLHCPLTPESHHLINAQTLSQMKPGVMLINTSRGGLIDTAAVIEAMKSRRIGYLGLDVYEQEENLFYEDLSGTIIQDDVFQRLQTFPNVLITSHQAFYTDTALRNIAATTIANLDSLASGMESPNEVRAKAA